MPRGREWVFPDPSVELEKLRRSFKRKTVWSPAIQYRVKGLLGRDLVALAVHIVGCDQWEFARGYMVRDETTVRRWYQTDAAGIGQRVVSHPVLEGVRIGTEEGHGYDGDYAQQRVTRYQD